MIYRSSERSICGPEADRIVDAGRQRETETIGRRRRRVPIRLLRNAWKDSSQWIHL